MEMISVFMAIRLPSGRHSVARLSTVICLWFLSCGPQWDTEVAPAAGTRPYAVRPSTSTDARRPFEKYAFTPSSDKNSARGGKGG